MGMMGYQSVGAKNRDFWSCVMCKICAILNKLLCARHNLSIHLIVTCAWFIYDVLMTILHNYHVGSVGSMGYLSRAFRRREKSRFYVVPNLRHLNNHNWDSHAGHKLPKESSGSMPRLSGVYRLNGLLGSAASFWSIESFVIAWRRIEFGVNAIHAPFTRANQINP